MDPISALDDLLDPPPSSMVQDTPPSAIPSADEFQLPSLPSISSNSSSNNFPDSHFENHITPDAPESEGLRSEAVAHYMGPLIRKHLMEEIDKRRREEFKKVMRKYEVFLSFRGEDTRSSFTSHLYTALQNAGINVFRDDDSLERGYHISDSLELTIETSQISVIVFSINYADSRWCMKELERIMKCHRTIGMVVLPVFYHVDPSDVRHQTGEFGNAFQDLLNRIPGKGPKLLSKESLGYRWRAAVRKHWELTWKDSIPEAVRKHWELRWRRALREAAGLARNESEAIREIVEKVTHLLDKTDLFIADNPVGVESRVQDMIQLLNIQQSNDVLLLGMWGMGGIGKTTIAKAIYNEIGRNFESRSFFANIREVWGQTSGKVYLQEQLLSGVFKGTTTKILSIDSGKNILKDRLCHKRVLLVLDDVNDLEQLDALCGNRKWFGPGSRIIITTRNMHILRGNRVDKVYTMKEMDKGESIELFSWHAFKRANPREDFARISLNVVKYSGGLPLALEVLGGYLFDREVTEWECVLEKLKRIPNDKVQEKLKISYDGLDDDYQKSIFLDIACFFIGMDRNDVMHILNGCGFFAENGISVLVERSLVTVNDKKNLECMICYGIWEEKSFVINHERTLRSAAGCGFTKMCLIYYQIELEQNLLRDCL